MDKESFGSTLSDIAFGRAMAAAARDYKQEVLAAEKEKKAVAEVDLDDLADDPELERLHAERIANLKREAEKRQSLQQKGHGEYREITEGDFLEEVTKSEKVVCHFYHQEFVRCKVVNKHLKLLAPKYMDTKFVMIDAEKCPFFVSKLAVKLLPCVILFRNGVAFDRIVGFQELGGIDDFPTSTFESLLQKKGIITKLETSNNEYSAPRNVRSSAYSDSDSE